MEPEQMSVHLQLASKPKKRETFEELNAKIDFITQFASKAYFNKALKKLARDQFENATTICDYIMAEQTEINIKQSTKEGKIKILIWLSIFHSGKSFAEMTKVDILSYLATLRKSLVEDPYQRWIGSYNGRQMILTKFFKWLYNPNEVGIFSFIPGIDYNIINAILLVDKESPLLTIYGERTHH